jgi:hypothetical protein
LDADAAEGLAVAAAWLMNLGGQVEERSLLSLCGDGCDAGCRL